MNFDTVIHNCKIITVNPEFDIIKHGVICIKEGLIVKISSKTHEQKLPDSKKIIDANGGIVMPGLVNAHSHLPMTLFRGLADDLPLDQWLNEHIFPAERKHINPESVRTGALLGCAEMLLSGTTTCCDGYFLEDHVASAVYDSGMRAVLGQGVIDFPAPGVTDPKENIKTAAEFAKKWQGMSSLISPSIFCHSPYTCSAKTLKIAKAAAKGILFQIHVAETKSEWDQIQSEHKISPVEYLDRIGVIDQNTLLVHGIWVDDNDIEIIAKRHAKVAHNPESNMKLASGIAPVPDFLEAGITVGLGTDGCASNNNLDLFQEMNVAAKLHKVNTLDPTIMDARTVLKMATIEGARAIGLDRKIGSIEIGKLADLIIIDTNSPHLVPMYDPVSHVVYTVRGSDVRDVFIGGKMIIRNKKLLTIDIAGVMEKAAWLGKTIGLTNQDR
ncbi:MAG: amidohydrolase [Desulfobacterales bacterium]|nr:amidohydrolase [Desulfobacterales bacterium]